MNKALVLAITFMLLNILTETAASASRSQAPWPDRISWPLGRWWRDVLPGILKNENLTDIASENPFKTLYRQQGL